MISRLFCIVHAMISYLFWNICSCPRSEIRDGWCRMIASVFLRLWPQAHLQAWTEMATTTCGTTLANPWSHIRTAPCSTWLPYSRDLAIQDCAAAATEEKNLTVWCWRWYCWKAELSSASSLPSSPSYGILHWASALSPTPRSWGDNVQVC